MATKFYNREVLLMDELGKLKNCRLCPRLCGVNRQDGYTGYCKAGYNVKAARAMLHKWEEPIISGGSGSGAVFFSNCSMSCVFCQNYNISQQHEGKEISIERLADIFLELQQEGADNINLVSPTHYAPQIISALKAAKSKGLNLPIIYNSNGYENVETLKMLEGFIDVYLPDIKYYSDSNSVKYSNAPHYFKFAAAAVLEMYRQVGSPVLENGMIKRGLIIRHLLLPGLLSDSKKIVDWISRNLPNSVYISLMSQYIPMYNAASFPEINRKVSVKSYEWLVDYCISQGLVNGFIQEYDSAETVYTPDFKCQGI